MSRKSTIECHKHGEREATFVCQHIAEGLRTRVAVGFFWAGSSAQKYPDAWCSECNDRVQRTNWEWVGEAAEHLGAKLLCAGCYIDARSLNLGPVAES